MALQKCGLNPDQRARELKPHGTAAFPCAAYEDWYGEEGRPEVPWHWHEELEAACVAEGAFCLQIPGERYVLETGDCVVINSGVPHSGIPQPKCRLQSLVFHPDLVGGNREQVFYKKYLSPLMETAAFKACVLRRDSCREETERFDRAFKAMAGEPEGFEFALREELSGLMVEKSPDAVIATHPLCARMVSRWKGETGSALPLITCVTDLSSHSEWIHKYTDCYLVGSNDIRSRLAAKGVDRDIICVTGIPVRCEFKRPVRRRPGRERNLLIMGGGLGLLPKRDSFYEALDALPGVHTTIITGNNRKLYDRLAGKYAHIEVLGFTDRVYDYMARADLVLTKPGGITMFESIFSELPILAWEPFLEQEKNNARFLVKRGLGRVAAKEPDECLTAIRELIYDDYTLADMSAKMHALKEQLEQESLTHILARLTAGKGVCA